MRYTIYYFFSFGKSSMGGSDDVCAKTPEDAVQKVRQLHPNASLRFTGIREREGKYAGRKLLIGENGQLTTQELLQ